MYQFFINTRKKGSGLKKKAHFFFLGWANLWSKIFYRSIYRNGKVRKVSPIKKKLRNIALWKKLQSLIKVPIHLARVTDPYEYVGYFCNMDLLIKHFDLKWHKHIQVSKDSILTLIDILGSDVENNTVSILEPKDMPPTIDDEKELLKCLEGLISTDDIIEIVYY